MSHYKAIREAFLDEAAKYRGEADVATTVTLRTVSLLIADVMEKAAKEWRLRETDADERDARQDAEAIRIIRKLGDIVGANEYEDNEEITDEIPSGAHRADEGEGEADAINA